MTPRIRMHVCCLAAWGALATVTAPAFASAPKPKPPALAAAPKTRLTADEVLRLAARAAELHGYKLDQFEPPRPPRFDPKDGTWFVSYQGKLRRPGNNFGVFVNDGTEKAEVFEGE